MRSFLLALALLLAAAAPAAAAGTLTVVSNGDFVDTDCGRAYYSYDYMLCYATQRPPYSYNPAAAGAPVPDLAEAPPEIGDGGRTITIRLRPGVRFSPPVGREVTSDDVKYAIERMFFRSVANGYAGAYLGDIVGARTGAKPGRRIRGLQTPDARTLVIRLKRTTAAAAVGALSLPGASPVPRAYARRYDRKRTSTYARHQVATGPYAVAAYKPSRSLRVERNPNWDRATDFRPAPLDGFVFKAGNDPRDATGRILDGGGLVSGDFAPPAGVIRSRQPARPAQFGSTGNGAYRYAAMNTSRKPFRDPDVRRAVLAAFDREAMRDSRGGPVVGDVATHLLPPGVPGFAEAGGAAGPPLDYLANPRGDMLVAQRYMKAAGYADGRYHGRAIRMIGVRQGVGRRAAQIARAQFEKLGFRVRLKLVSPDAMYSRYCQRPRSHYDVCPNVAWGKDFDDPQTLLDVPFNGRNIVREGNSNHALFDNGAINRAMEAAKRVVDPGERARAWAAIDRRLMGKAAAVPWLWDRQTAIASADVAPVLNPFTANWDMAFTGLR
ncbi:MAG TPA: ABC transporter substrate-binding protein [Solirubrobacteraceae bacterium]|jgi:peptide/nickel transport system substrate-binding protein